MKRLSGIVSAIIVATVVFTMVFAPTAMAEGETLAVDTVVKIVGLGYSYLGCWTTLEKRPWMWSDYKFFQDYCQEAVDLRGQTGTIEGTVWRFLYVRVGEFRYWFPREAIVRVSSMILKEIPPVRYLPECGVPATPTPAPKQVIPTKVPCQVTYIVQWGDSLERIANGHGTTVKALAELNDFADIDVIWAGSKICVR